MLERLRGTAPFLLVIAVGVAGLALWQPVIRAQQPTSTTLCLANLKQIGQALRMYVADYGAYPVANQNARGQAHGIVAAGTKDERHVCLRDTMKAYLTTDAVWRCPEQAKVYPATVDGSYGYMCAHDPRNTTLGRQAALAGVSSDSCMVCGSKAAAIKNPTTKIMVFCDDLAVHSGQTRAQATASQVGGTPVCYVDGHVSYLSGSQIEIVRALLSPK